MAKTLKEINNENKISFYIQPIRVKRSVNFDISKTFEENVSANFREVYAHCVEFEVYQGTWKKEIIAKITVVILDEAKRKKDSIELSRVNLINTDAASSFKYLFDDEEYQKSVGDSASFLCYIDRFYVMPKYRRKGIGTYLLENLPNIIEFYFNYRVQAITTYPAPMCLSGETMTDLQQKRMLTKIKRHFEHVGYREMNRSNFYIKIYEKESEN